MQMKNQSNYTFLIDFFIVITLRDVLSNHLLKVIINDIVVWQLVASEILYIFLVFKQSKSTWNFSWFYFYWLIILITESTLFIVSL